MRKSHVKLITSFEEFKSLEHDWNNIYDKSDRCTIFSSWDWMITWWEVFQHKGKRELFIICQYEENQLVGIAPFYLEKAYPLSFLQGKTLRFIGSSYKNEIMTEFSDFIVKQNFESQFVSAVSDFLIKNKKRWNFADFEFLLSDALVLKCFSQSENQVHRQKIQYGVRYLIPKMTSAEDYQNLIGSRWSKSFKRKNRALERDGNSTTEGIDKLENIEPMFNRLADMHRERWQHKVDICAFDKPEFQEFHLKVLERLVPKGKADIKTIKLDDQALASMYCFEDKGQIHYYQSGFYTEYGNKYSPLFMLICNQIGSVSKENKRFDFMFDDNLNSYKKNQYCADGKEMYRLKLTPQPYRFIVYNFVKNTVNAYRNTKSTITNTLVAND